MNIYNADCVVKLKELDENSVDSIVCDAPYFIRFMSKKWDATDHIASTPAVWTECLRVLKPGGHLLAFGHSRTHHRLFTAIEDAGFQIKDTILWIYGSGFPKSHNIGKSVAKKDPNNKEWEGWGSALKPSMEPICLAQKPREGTYADNVLKHGVGGINIDGCRVGTSGGETHKGGFQKDYVGSKVDYEKGGVKTDLMPKGRFPANLILDEEAGSLLDEQSGTTKAGKRREGEARPRRFFSVRPTCDGEVNSPDNYGDGGGASRFFYCAKSGKKERNKYMPEDAPLKSAETRTATGAGIYAEKGFNPPRRNHHPTIKPFKLMTYLIKLITPAGGTVLDPFMGSGSTGIAAIEGGWKFIGVEKDKEYFAIAKARLQNCEEQNE